MKKDIATEGLHTVSEKSRRGLLLAAPILCISMLVAVPLLTAIMGKTLGYLLAFCIYWLLFCLPVSMYASSGFGGLRGVYSLKPDNSHRVSRAYYFLAFLPCVATFVVVFRVVAPAAGHQVLLIAAVFAFINGFCEELFWRGAYNLSFKNVLHAYIYPSVFFGIWHIALFLAKGIKYQGGFAALVGGALFMGLLWGWIAYRTKSIKVVTVAHTITNFFAFTGLIFDNWFSR